MDLSDEAASGKMGVSGFSITGSLPERRGSVLNGSEKNRIERIKDAL
jgi:hypothetical protein